MSWHTHTVIAAEVLFMLLVKCQPNLGFEIKSISAIDFSENDVRQFFGFCLKNNDCNQTNFEVCNIFGQCDCHPTTQLNFEDLTCRICPSLDVTCNECCTRANYKCIFGVCRNCMEYKCDFEYQNEDPSAMEYGTASQIALSAALVLGSVAILALLYRVCSIPLNRNRPRQETSRAGPSTFQRISQRLSLNSMQIRILSRLQDRPPKYETQHNYDTRIQIDRERHNPETLPDSSPTPIPTVSTDAIYLAPPAYDDGRYSLNDLPPAYTPSKIDEIVVETVIEEAPTVPNSTSTNAGIDNNSRNS